jgi:hypothetical protein
MELIHSVAKPMEDTGMAFPWKALNDDILNDFIDIRAI